MDRVKRLIDVIRSLMAEEFDGYIKINFSQGSLGRIEKYEEFHDTAIIHARAGNGRSKRERMVQDNA